MVSIRAAFNSYQRHLPKDIPGTAFKSAMYSFAISAILSQNIHIGLISAALAATASVIGSLTLPLFRQAFADQYGDIKWYQKAASIVFSLAVTQVLANSFTHHRVNMLVQGVWTLCLSLFMHGFQNQSTRKSSTYIVV